MTQDEKTKSLMNLIQLLHDNAGQRVTLVFMNGLSVTHGEFLDTLIVAVPPAEAQNAPITPSEEGKE